MHFSTYLTSAFAVGALALPNQLDKRQQVTVTVTVTVNPYTKPAWTAPQFSQTPNTRRPTNAPPLWTPPRVGNSSPVRTSSSTSRPGLPSVTPPGPSSPSSTTAPTSAQSPGTGLPSSFITNPISAPSVGVPSVGIPSSSTPVVPSGASTTPAPSVGPAHISGPSQATLSVGLEYQAAILYHHNAARANHGAGPLVWDDTCAQTAALAANTCKFEHYIPSGVNQGQNLFTVSGSAFNVTAAITESWYKDEFAPMLNFFGVASIPNNVFPEVGHLTQLLWKSTTKVGCVSLDCGDRMTIGGQPTNLNKYTVCNYAPAGNVGGQFAINVGRPISTVNLGSWLD